MMTENYKMTENYNRCGNYRFFQAVPAEEGVVPGYGICVCPESTPRQKHPLRTNFWDVYGKFPACVIPGAHFEPKDEADGA